MPETNKLNTGVAKKSENPSSLQPTDCKAFQLKYSSCVQGYGHPHVMDLPENNWTWRSNAENEEEQLIWIIWAEYTATHPVTFLSR